MKVGLGFMGVISLSFVHRKNHLTVMETAVHLEILEALESQFMMRLTSSLTIKIEILR
jgi:hypothetical protein